VDWAHCTIQCQIVFRITQTPICKWFSSQMTDNVNRNVRPWNRAKNWVHTSQKHTPGGLYTHVLMHYAFSHLSSLTIHRGVDSDDWFSNDTFFDLLKVMSVDVTFWRSCPHWFFKGFSSLSNDWFDGTLASIHLIGWWVSKGVVSFSLDVCTLIQCLIATGFPVSLIFFPGWG